MVCPICNADNNRVVHTSDLAVHVVRDRKCLACGHNFKTSEDYDYQKLMNTVLVDLFGKEVLNGQSRG